MRASLRPPSQRLHGLDALRAFALLLGVVLHSVLPFSSAPGAWAVGTREPVSLLGWLVYYLHSFRLELFFLMAGFFGALVIERRGAAAYLRDRTIRVLLVFLVFLYPTKLLLAALWIRGGLRTGWLQLPPERQGWSLMSLAVAQLQDETWPRINLTHLWFLYALFCLSVLFVAARALALRVKRPRRLESAASALLSWLASSWLAPLLLALMVTPLIAAMRTASVDTPDASFAWDAPVMGLYSIFFLLGVWLHRHQEALPALARHFGTFLIVGFLASWPGAFAAGQRALGLALAIEHPNGLRWASSLCTAVVMACSVLGWLGCFVAHFERPSARLRYLADASYWVYIAHLPVLVAFQVWWALWGLHWWVAVPLSNALVLLVLLPLYHWGIRSTWLGAWLNGRRHSPGKPAQA